MKNNDTKRDQAQNLRILVPAQDDEDQLYHKTHKQKIVQNV